MACKYIYNNVNKDNLTTIVISGTIQITAPVTIPANKGILIVGKDDTSMIQRAAGFTGNLFDVSGVLYMLDNSDSTLVVDGGSVNGVPAAGSLIHVASGAKFSMSTGITLTNNKVVADATTADIPDSTDKRYVTDAKLTVLNNTSGTNTGDQTGANLPITTPLGYTSNNQQGLDNEFATKITGIETQISANQLTFASIYGYYNFI